MLAAIDESLYQVAILFLLGAGSLVKSLLERKRKREGLSEAGEGESVSKRQREDTKRRLAEVEEDHLARKKPWQAFLEAVEPQTAEDRADPEQEAFVEELPVETVLLEEFVASAAAPTPEVSILGTGLTGEGKMEGFYDEGTTSTEPWDPGRRIRKSVFEDIERSVSTDISEHVRADMGSGMRGEATKAETTTHVRRNAHRGWREAVVAAEILGAPLAMRDSASLPGGLRN